MPRWKPEPVWDGLDVFVIGGGPSLKTFNWDLLKPSTVMSVGTNDAYLQGNDACTVNIFGDFKWWKKHIVGLKQYDADGGVVFTSCPQLQRTAGARKGKLDWVWVMERRSAGFHEEALGWCGNTGANAINLALLLGALRIYLLGFDMHLGKHGEANWHDNPLNKPDGNIYKKFVREMSNLDKHLANKFPGREIYNVTEDSALNVFPKLELELFFKERMAVK